MVQAAPGHTMRTAIVNLNPSFPISLGTNAFTPCATFPDVARTIQNRLTTDAAEREAILTLLGIPYFGPGQTGLHPAIEYDIYLDRWKAYARSRGMTTHEYGHFVMCDFIEAGLPRALPDLYDDRMIEMIRSALTLQLNRSDRVSAMMESFADTFAAQVASGVNYAHLEQAVTAQVKYCREPTVKPTCLEFDYRGINDADSTDSYRDEISRLVSTYFDAFDRSDDASRSVAGLPSNGDRWKQDPTTMLLVPEATGYQTNSDNERIQLPSNALFDWIQDAIPRSCNANDCAWTTTSLSAGLADTIKDNGYSWCDACEMFSAHDPGPDAGANVRGIRMWRLCRAGELARILWSPPTADPDLHLDANCAPCGANQIVRNRVCEDCPPNRFPDSLEEKCVACPADRVWDLSAEPNPACTGLSLSSIQNIKAPNDTCPDRFVLEVKGLRAIDSTSPLPSSLQTFLTGYATSGDLTCTPTSTQWQGTIEFDFPVLSVPLVVAEQFFKDVPGAACPTGLCQAPCACVDSVCINPTVNISTRGGSDFDNVEAFRINVNTTDAPLFNPQLNITSTDHCPGPT
jgi:hypothetical protein